MRLILNNKKASGFASAISLLFVFLIIMSMIGASFFMLIDDARQKGEILEKNKDSLSKSEVDYELSSPYYSSGRLNFLINNTGSEKLFFRDMYGIECFSVFVNDVFVSKDNFFINLLAPSSVNYDFINSGGSGVLSLTNSFDFDNDIKIKTISCSGSEEYYEIVLNKLNWYDESWKDRKNLSVKNTYNLSLSEYQLEIQLNSSNYDFNSGREEDIRFVMPYREIFKLDLPFDSYTQELIDYSNYNNNVTLGFDNTAQDNDPSSEDGVLLEALFFDGNDFVEIEANNSLLIDNSITYSFWIKWNETGDTIQTIIYNSNSSIGIINDGGANDDSIFFNLSVDGVSNVLYSNITLDDKWHFVVGTYNEFQMKIYIDSILASETYMNGSIDTTLVNNYLGYNPNGLSNYTGRLDEVKIMNYGLEENEVIKLYNNNLDFKLLDYYVSIWDGTLNEAIIFTKLPSIGINETINLNLYFNNPGVQSLSNIETTFSYLTPRLVGYINNDRIANTIGLSIISLYDDNHIIVGDDVFFLDEQGVVDNLDSADILITDGVYSKKLVNIGGDGGGTDIINPISWAGTEFALGRMNNNPDIFCMNSPFGIADYEIYQAGALDRSGQVALNGTCITDLNYAASDNTYLSFSIPTQVYSYGSTANDPFVMYPMKSGNYFLVPSARYDISAGPTDITALWYDSNGEDGSFDLTAFTNGNRNTLGNDGAAYAVKVLAQDKIGILKETDSDGNDMATFLHEMEMGVRFGSNEAIDYLVMASPHSDANCSTYDETSTLVDNIVFGTGQNGIYNYSFGNIGTDTTYLTANWALKCDKPVNPYAEMTTNDERNLLGHLQMRQYVYPEPTIIIS